MSISGTPGSFSHTSEFGDGIEVLYQYTEQNPEAGGINVAYQYSDGLEETSRIVGGRAAETQAIMNNLPQWMDMRQKHDSVGQQLVHAWGKNLDDTLALYDQYRKDEFLATAEAWEDLHTSVSELSFGTEEVYRPNFRNLLYNSSFSIKAHGRAQRPQGWQVSRFAIDGINFDTSDSLFGNHSIVMDPVYRESMLTQVREDRIVGGSLAASIYYKPVTGTAATTEKYDASEAGIILTIEYYDGTVDSYGVGFLKSTGDKWSRASFIATLTKETSRISFSIVNNSSTKYKVDLPMLEVGKSPSPWTPSAFDVPPYLNGAVRTVTAVQVIGVPENGKTPRKYEVFQVGSEADFKEVQIPTRLEPFYPDSDPLPVMPQALGRQIDFFGQVYPTKWHPVSGKLQEKSLTSNDVFGNVLPVDLVYNANGELVLDTRLLESGMEVLASCTYRGLIYTVTKETYANKTGYYLKFVRPDKIRYEDTYVESLGDIGFELDLGPNFGIKSIDEEVNRIGLCKKFPGVIFIDTTRDRRFYFRLRYDYFYADFTRRKLFFRERYLDRGAKIQVL